MIRDDGVVVGSLEVGLSQHQPCMPRVKDEASEPSSIVRGDKAVEPSCDYRCCLLLGTNGYSRLLVTCKLFV